MSRPHPASQPPGRLTDSRLGGWIRILETWYDDDPGSLEGFDVWICHQRSRPLSDQGWLYFYTIHLDLSPEPAELLSRMRSGTAKEIRQAEARDGLAFRINLEPSWDDLEDFARFYDANPRTPAQRPLDRGRLRDLHRAGLLRITTALTAPGVEIVRHLLLDHARSGIIQILVGPSLLHGTEDKELIKAVGRANRWLFYQEMLFFRERGHRVYDLNGWYGGLEDGKRININNFKEGFRGRVVYGYDTLEPVTWRGRVFLFLKELKANLLVPGHRKERRRRRTKALRAPEGLPEPTLQSL